MKVVFLFNHDQVHQVAHSLPIALALAASGCPHEIVVATTSARLTAEVRRLGGDVVGKRISLVQLGLRTATSRMLKLALDKLVPATKLLIYRDNLDFFSSADVLVVAEKTSLILKTRYGLHNLKIVHTRHGAGDRAIGFDKASAMFDHVLASGPKIRDRLTTEAGVDPARVSVVGYPKFDFAPKQRPVLPFARQDLPVVLYNPHPSPHLSSWYEMGRQVLDFFLEQGDRYNLIFAPHVMLFERPFVVTIDKLRIDRAGTIDRRYHDAPNIHIDLGSSASTDMTYTAAADIYLGDVSSQIYEFLLEARPCVFLNPHHVAYRDDPNYAHWKAGQVVDDIDRLGSALEAAAAAHPEYLPVQKALFERSFDLTDRPSAERAARVILDVLGDAA